MDKDRVLVSGAVLFRMYRGKPRWFVVRVSEENKWEIPKVVVRKGESSVRASIRMSMDMAGLNAKVLEEVGRAGGTATINGKVVPQRHIYYLATPREKGGEVLGFEASKWLEYAKAIKQLSTKREKTILREARKVYTKWKREQASLEL